MTPADFKHARQSMGLTQTQAAAAFGVTLRHVHNWESKGPSGTAARYMTALSHGYRPQDWPVRDG